MPDLLVILAVGFGAFYAGFIAAAILATSSRGER
jgi:hypothetical protein